MVAQVLVPSCTRQIEVELGFLVLAWPNPDGCQDLEREPADKEWSLLPSFPLTFPPSPLFLTLLYVEANK